MGEVALAKESEELEVFRFFPVLRPRQVRVNRILIYREARSLTLNDS